MATCQAKKTQQASTQSRQMPGKTAKSPEISIQRNKGTSTDR
jgi:hypothetical protein